MEFSLPHVKTHSSSSQFLNISVTNHSTSHNLQIPGGYGNVGNWRIRQPCDDRKRRTLSKMKCAKSGSVGEIERRLEGDENVIEVDLGDKCKEVNGIVELLECLEREAIMGEDEGKEPMDYNRRAQIFDKSSRIFQALKERSESTT